MHAPNIPQVQRLLDVSRSATPLCNPAGQAFLSLPLGPESQQVVPLASPLAKFWLSNEYQKTYSAPPSPALLSQALDFFQAHAAYSTLSGPVHNRLAPAGDKILLDLQDDPGRIVEISSTEWRVSGSLGIHFRRKPTAPALPTPLPAKSLQPLETLRRLLNLPDPADWARCLAWILAALKPAASYPILVLHGPSASGKSTAVRLLRALLDPGLSPVCPLPSSVSDLFSLAQQNWILAFDHVTRLTPEMGHALARLSSGVSLAARERKSHGELLEIHLQRPIVLSAAASLQASSSFTGRSLVIALPALPASTQRSPQDLQTEFEAARPEILGALCTAVSAALARAGTLHIQAERMTPTAQWTAAAAPSLGLTEAAMAAAFRLKTDPVAIAIRTFMRNQDSWTGTATELLTLLTARNPYVVWPKSPKGLSQLLQQTTLDGFLVETLKSQGTRYLGLTRCVDASSIFKPQHASLQLATY